MYRLIPIYWLGFLWGLLKRGVPLICWKLRHADWDNVSGIAIVLLLAPVMGILGILEWIKRNWFGILVFSFPFLVVGFMVFGSHLDQYMGRKERVSVRVLEGQVDTRNDICFYYCTCTRASACNCDDWEPAGEPHCSAGDRIVDHAWYVTITKDRLPTTVRFTATSRDAYGNESEKGAAGATDTHTFSMQ